MKADVILIMILMKVCAAKDFYASIIQLEDIFKNEGKVLTHLETLVETFEGRIEIIKEKIVEMRSHRAKIKDVSQFLQNPINSFVYIKNLNEFLMFINEFVLEPTLDLLQMFEESDTNIGWPSQEDIEGAASALIRLQTTYNLDMKQLIEGNIYKFNSYPLNADDCFIIGETAFKKNNLEMAGKWLGKALDLCNTDSCSTILKINITEYYAYTKFSEGKLKESLALTKTLLGHEPGHERGLSNQNYLLDEINNETLSQSSGMFMKNPYGQYDSDKLYYYLCQRKFKQPKILQSQLKCIYTHHNNPYLMLGPVKTEEAFLDPRIVLYKDVLFDSEIEEIKAIARRTLQRSATYGGNTDIRVSKVAWLDHEFGEVIEKVSKRFATYSDLSLRTAESLQVVNYGLGGHYLAHIDAYGEEESVEEFGSIGNRIATFLVYMNDVDEGGDTVFPLLGVDVKPEKGSAVLWYNLLDDGSIDKRTLHAACPVLVGTKWAGNLWFHSGYNEYKKPCQLRVNASQINESSLTALD